MGLAGSEDELLVRLRAGDESAFLELVGQHHRQLIRLASAFVARAETAEDVAQETWLAVLRGIDRFEGRSALRTWLFQICANRARSIGAGERRSVPVENVEPAVDAEQFTPTGAWTSPPVPWPDAAAHAAYDADLVELIRLTIGELPTMQQSVVTMRDLDGLTSAEVCQVLSITESNQRVLLHRGRERIRSAISKTMVSR